MSGDRKPEDDYIFGQRRRLLYIFLFLLIAIAVAVYSFGVGSAVIDFDIAIEVIINRLNGIIPDRSEDYWAWLKDMLVIEDTMPRALGGLAIGAILGICGAVMQSCVRNPLASPYTTGISAAALFGVTISLVLGFRFIPIQGEFGLIINAFVMAMVPSLIMIIISIRRKTTPTMLILIGIGVMYLFNAFTMIMKYRAEPDILKQIQLWSIGSLTGISWTAVWVLGITLVALLFFMMFYSKKLDVVSSGENQSISLGVRPDRVRIVCMVIISACTAVAVAFSGAIGFVGLIIPHLSRLFVGAKTNMLIPCSAVLGALLLITSDVVARLLSNGLPVGAVTALIGSPIFIYFLIRIRSNGWGR